MRDSPKQRTKLASNRDAAGLENGYYKVNSRPPIASNAAISQPFLRNLFQISPRILECGRSNEY